MQDENEIPITSNQKRQSHQMKALLYKTASIQSKQICTNICQILTPIICLVFAILIRNVALQNLSSNNDNVYNKFPLLGFKFNDYEYLNAFNDWIFNFGCNRWFLYDWKNDSDAPFIGKRDGMNQSTGMLGNILKTNPYTCYVNDSFTSPYRYSKKQIIPYFVNPRTSINDEIYSRYLYFNQMSLKNVRSTSAVDKMPDGAVYFREANKQKLDVDVKINDERSFELHGNNGMTRIQIKDPERVSDEHAGYQTFFTITQGLLSTIDALTTSYIKQLYDKTIVSGYIYMPITGSSSEFIQMLINIICTILFPLSLSLGLPVMLYNLVLQKQTKIVQMMRMNGMSITVYWFVNIAFYFIVTLLTAVVFYVFGYYVMANTFFMQTGFGVFWTMMIGWIICQISMAIFLQVFITGSRAANIIGYLMAIWTNLVGATLSIALYQFPVFMPLGVMLWPTIAFNRMFYLLFINCSADHCVSSFSQLSEQMIQCLSVIYIAAFVFLILGIYLSEIVPQQFGVTKSVWFPLISIKRAICGKKNQRNKNQRITFNDQIQVEEEKKSQNYDSLVQRQIQQIKQNKFIPHPLICSNLTKVYSNGKQATMDFNLLIKDNQIFGLLGPNGAGKTTLISMITGIHQPTLGTASIAGYEINSQMDKVYMNMGVCPQFDILWQNLTVQDHLLFYARLRGVKAKDQKKRVKQTIQQIALEQFAKFKVKQLSGGMKRRLSVAISLVGDPKIVFLDEPTTGLDPQNRRKLWELLANCKQKRSLFITTHLMEEAETLCDRVGIITSGYLRTVGSKMQLKQKYGRGYGLVVSVQQNKESGKSRREMGPNYQSQDMQNDGYSQLSPSYSSSYSQPTHQSVASSEPYQQNIINNSIYMTNYAAVHPTRQLSIIKTRIYEAFGRQNCLLQKQINGTLKFNISSQVKMSQILQTLIQIKSKHQSKSRILYQQEESEPQIDFQWAIGHSSLQDVFFNVVQKYQKNNFPVSTQDQ